MKRLSVIFFYVFLPLCTFFLFHSYRKEDLKEPDTDKEAAMEAELRAARERAVVPLEARMTQFREMLLERGVNQCLYFKCFMFQHKGWIFIWVKKRALQYWTLGQGTFILRLKVHRISFVRFIFKRLVYHNVVASSYKLLSRGRSVSWDKF